MSFVFVANLGLFWGGLPMTVFGGGGAAASPKSVPELVSGVFYQDVGGNLLINNKDALVAVHHPAALMAALTAFVSGTRLGTAMRASAQNPVAARLMGIDVDRVIAATASPSASALAGVAAVVYSLFNNTIYFQMGYRLGMDAFTAAVLGGIGNLPGAALGGLLIGLVRSLLRGLHRPGVEQHRRLRHPHPGAGVPSLGSARRARAGEGMKPALTLRADGHRRRQRSLLLGLPARGSSIALPHDLEHSAP